MEGENSGVRRPSGRLGPLATATCLAIVVALLALALLAQSRRHVTAEFTAQAQAPGRLQVFHDDRGQFGELHSRWFAVDTQPRTYRLRGSGRGLRQLRFDPPAGVAVRLCGPRLAGADEHETTHVKDVDVRADGECPWLVPRMGAQDPQWSMVFRGPAEQSLLLARTWQRIFLAALGGAALLLAWLGYTLRGTLGRWLEAVRASQRLQWVEQRLHWVLAALMLGLGGAYAVITPPGAVADEEAHLAKVVRVAYGIPFGGSDDVRLPNPRQMYGPFSDYLINKAAFTRPQLTHQLARPLACQRTTTALAVGANGYFPHQYLLPALAFRAGCAMHASFGTFLYLSRLLNLLLATALVAWGVKHAQRAKWGLLAVALLPMSLFQMASLSADSLTLSLSLAWLGLVSGVAGGTLDPKRARWALGAVALGVALLKPGTAWILVCLVFCRTAYRDAGMSFPRALAAFVLVPWAVHVAWTLVASAEAPVLTGVDQRENVRHLLAHPLAFPATLVNTLTGSHALMVLQRMIGVLGWLDVFLSNWSYYAGAAALLVAAACGRDAVIPPARSTVPLALLCAAGSLALIALPLYLLWTPIGSPIVQGLQGRYYLPTLAFVLAWCAWRSPPRLRAVLALGVVGALVAINVDALVALDTAYFRTGR